MTGATIPCTSWGVLAPSPTERLGGTGDDV
ncbi:hypothetical protein P3T29_006442 [Kitasatospora sp. MAP5-34]|nr:hypothetical protein [Kitasatospora sp. MAP5-34]